MKKILFSILMLCCMSAAWAEGDGFVTVASSAQMRDAIQANNSAKVRLTQDIYLSDLGETMETLCSTFYGTIDGDGHTVYGDHYGDNSTERRNRNYLFTYSDGATFKNLTFKHLRKNSSAHSNQAIITSQAKNNCVFENITFDNVGCWSDYNNVGAAAGYAYNSTFTNIKVMNSDFTVDDNYVGTVVGDADKCTFTNIEVIHCESTAYDDYAGGVVGHSRNCVFENVDINDSFIKIDGRSVGGVAAKAVDGSKFTNCRTDDQTCICADGTIDSNIRYGKAGGIVGEAFNTEIRNCINSALVACDCADTGGIVGSLLTDGIIEGCLNTGMVISISKSTVVNELYNKYKTKSGLACVTKTYQGKEYVIRKYDGDNTGYNYFGGIAGAINHVNLSKCVNFGTVYTKGTEDLPVEIRGSSGGIVGYMVNESTISDCLSDFTSSINVKGICGRARKNTTVKNCLNLTTYKDISPYTTYEEDSHGSLEPYFSINNYSLSTYADAAGATKTNESDVMKGKICNLLGAAWEQNIGTDTYPTPTGNKGLYHSRNISNQYGTVCLPFPVQSNDKIRYYTFSEASAENGTNLKFTYAENVEPGIPVLFRSAEAKDANDNELPVEVCFSNAGNGYAEEAKKVSSQGNWTMLGTFNRMIIQNAGAINTYYVSGGAIKNASSTEIPAYRAYFHGAIGGAETKVRIVVEDEDGTTSIITPSEWSSLPSREGWGGSSYSLMGTEVGDNYRGIVIRNGKKYLRK